MRIKLFLLVGLVSIQSSCLTQKNLERKLNKYNSELGYLHDSKQRDCDKNIHVNYNLNDLHDLDSITRANKLFTTFLPLFFYYSREIQCEVVLGMNGIDRPYSEFFDKSLLTEVNRTGCFSLDSAKSDENLVLEIEIDGFKSSSVYRKFSSFVYLLVAYVSYEEEGGKEAETSLKVNVRLKEGENFLFSKDYFIEKSVPYIKGGQKGLTGIRSYFITNMVESLSMATKDCIEEIIDDLNRVVVDL